MPSKVGRPTAVSLFNALEAAMLLWGYDGESALNRLSFGHIIFFVIPGSSPGMTKEKKEDDAIKTAGDGEKKKEFGNDNKKRLLMMRNGKEKRRKEKKGKRVYGEKF